jgi:hypothetical protein
MAIKNFRKFDYDADLIAVIDSNDYYAQARSKNSNQKELLDIFGFWGWMECAHHWKKDQEPHDGLRNTLGSIRDIHYIHQIVHQGSHSVKTWDGTCSVTKRMGRCLFFSGYANINHGVLEGVDYRTIWKDVASDGRSRVASEIKENVLAMSPKLMKFHLCVGNYRWKLIEKLVFEADDFNDQIKNSIV